MLLPFQVESGEDRANWRSLDYIPAHKNFKNERAHK